MGLRDIGRQINRLTAARPQAKNRLQTLRAKSHTLALLIEDETEGIERRNRRSNDWHRPRASGSTRFRITGNPWILCAKPRESEKPAPSSCWPNSPSWTVRLGQSGNSVSRPGRLSKAGKDYLRCALYMPALSALSAVRFDPNANAFYEALQKRGKKKIQVLCAAMRKYLTGLWACIKLNVSFNSNLLLRVLTKE